MSKKARKFSSSAILWQGISPLTIFVNMVIFLRRKGRMEERRKGRMETRVR
jgi:hypothetical protein